MLVLVLGTIYYLCVLGDNGKGVTLAACQGPYQVEEVQAGDTQEAP